MSIINEHAQQALQAETLQQINLRKNSPCFSSQNLERMNRSQSQAGTLPNGGSSAAGRATRSRRSPYPAQTGYGQPPYPAQGQTLPSSPQPYPSSPGGAYSSPAPEFRSSNSVGAYSSPAPGPNTYGGTYPPPAGNPSAASPYRSAPPQPSSAAVPAYSSSYGTAMSGNGRIITHPVPPLENRIQKGQRVSLNIPADASIDLALGWSTTNQFCDLDVSAFLLGENDKVPGEDWFVFYGQDTSPDKSTVFHVLQNEKDLQKISVDLKKLHPSVQKIRLVLTINEAFAHRLNFSMVKDAYVRILYNKQEVVSYLMTDYYSNVISMVIGDLYRYKGSWKLNAVGNGIDKDLAGLCGQFGVEVID